MNTRFSATASGLLLAAVSACMPDAVTGPHEPETPVFATTGIAMPTDLGTLGGPRSRGANINASGQIVGSSLTSVGWEHAFLWQAGVMTDLGTWGYLESYAIGISDAGHIVGEVYGADGLPTPFLWQNGTMRRLPLPGNEGGAFDVNASGQVVGWGATYDDPEGPSGAMLWTNGFAINLATGGVATAINARGQVVGMSGQAFLYDNGTVRDLGTLGGTESNAYDLNTYKQVVGQSTTSAGSSHAFLWEGGRMRDLGTLGDAKSTAYGINDNGQVVGRSYPTDGAGTAFVWYNGVMSPLGSLGGNNSVATAINAGGQVVGSSNKVTGGPQHAVRWTLPPVNFWTGRTALPSARRDAAVVAVNGLVYVIGGVNSAGTALRTVSLYNPSTNAWSTGVSLPASRQAGTGAAVIGNLLYVAGGYDAAGALSRTLYTYNLTTKTWSTKAPLPLPSGCGGSGVISGKLYVFTGCTGSSSGGTTRAGLLHRYDPSTNSWATLRAAPAAHYQPAVAVISGKLYVAGGIDAVGNVSRRLDVYTPSTNAWATKASMPTARRAPAGALVGGRFHVIGGLNSGTYLTTVEAYDPVTNFWVSRAAGLTARSGFGVGVVNGVGYAVGGRNSTSALTANQRYTP